MEYMVHDKIVRVQPYCWENLKKFSGSERDWNPRPLFNCSLFGQSFVSLGHFSPIYQPPIQAYLLNSFNRKSLFQYSEWEIIIFGDASHIFGSSVSRVQIFGSLHLGLGIYKQIKSLGTWCVGFYHSPPPRYLKGTVANAVLHQHHGRPIHIYTYTLSAAN